MFKEFKEFVVRGNVLDLAVAVIMGAAFGAIVTSFVNDIVMPPIGLLVGKIDFSNLYVNLSGQHFATLADAKKAGIPTINYGVFLNALINFLIVAATIFFVIKQANRLQRKQVVKPEDPTTKACAYCFSTIPLRATRCPSMHISVTYRHRGKDGYRSGPPPPRVLMVLQVRWTLPSGSCGFARRLLSARPLFSAG